MKFDDVDGKLVDATKNGADNANLRCIMLTSLLLIKGSYIHMLDKDEIGRIKLKH